MAWLSSICCLAKQLIRFTMSLLCCLLMCFWTFDWFLLSSCCNIHYTFCYLPFPSVWKGWALKWQLLQMRLIIATEPKASLPCEFKTENWKSSLSCFHHHFQWLQRRLVEPYKCNRQLGRTSTSHFVRVKNATFDFVWQAIDKSRPSCCLCPTQHGKTYHDTVILSSWDLSL